MSYTIDILFIDSNVFVKFFVEGENCFERVHRKYLLATSCNVLEEVAYILLKFKVIDETGRIKHYEILNFLQSNPESIKAFAKEIEKDIENIIENYKIILLYPHFEGFMEMMKKYGLLPNDALIAATCKYYSIKKIATFDDDFRRVDFLEVIKLNDNRK